MSGPLEAFIRRATGATDVAFGERVQSLWGGYGEIRRVTLSGTTIANAVVKHVSPPVNPEATRHGPEGRSHRRKLRSYAVERAFYRTYARRCDADCRVPVPLAADEDGPMLLVLEDLDAAGFGVRRQRVSETELHACISWLAAFHATFLDAAPEALWPVGTYWHLATRPDELRALGDRALRRAAPWLDSLLDRARFRTFVHGDAKLQNFCFAESGRSVAAVDFQYVGGGPGIKDVAYFLSSCLSPERLEREAGTYVDAYFEALRRALRERAPDRTKASLTNDFDAVEAEWRALYPIACADFYRFLLGWAGEDGGRDRYLEGVTRAVLMSKA